MNYSKEMTEYMVAQYIKQPNRNTVAELAQKFNKPEKSIIGKLSREGVYRRHFYTTKSGEDPVTKSELVSEISTNLGLENESLLGLEKAPKSTLRLLVDATNPE